MNTLWYTRSTSRTSGNISFLHTAENEETAKANHMSMIAEFCRAEFTITCCEPVCQTPDTVLCFEPV